MIKRNKCLYRNARDVNDFLKDGGRFTKLIIRRCPANSAHIILYTPPCHQVSCLVAGGLLGWTGKTSTMIHSCALHRYTVKQHIPNTFTRVTFLETSGSLRLHAMHQEYVCSLLEAVFGTQATPA